MAGCPTQAGAVTSATSGPDGRQPWQGNYTACLSALQLEAQGGCPKAKGIGMPTLGGRTCSQYDTIDQSRIPMQPASERTTGRLVEAERHPVSLVPRPSPDTETGTGAWPRPRGCIHSLTDDQLRLLGNALGLQGQQGLFGRLADLVIRVGGELPEDLGCLLATEFTE